MEFIPGSRNALPRSSSLDQVRGDHTKISSLDQIRRILQGS